MSFQGCAGDSAFGPAVRGCRADFDFTLKFEKIILGMIPVAILIAVAIPRTVYLAGKPAIIKGLTLRLLKSVSFKPHSLNACDLTVAHNK